MFAKWLVYDINMLKEGVVELNENVSMELVKKMAIIWFFLWET